MNSISGENWIRFVRDCSDAFRAGQGYPIRKWKASITDADGAIKSAIRTVDSSVQHFLCWFHFVSGIKKNWLRLSEQWSPINEVIKNLLYTDHMGTASKLATEARQLVNGLQDAALRTKYHVFLEDVIQRRLLPGLQFFTNGWTSQSAAEAINAAISKLHVREDISLLFVLDKLLHYCESRVTRPSRTSRAALN